MIYLFISIILAVFFIWLIFSALKVVIKIAFWLFIGIPVGIALILIGMHMLGAVVLLPCALGCISLIGGR